MLSEANKIVSTITVEKCKSIQKNKDFVFVDFRDYGEILKDGKLPGAYSCPRGMLEFWIDPYSPYHKEFFNQDKTYIFLFCKCLEICFGCKRSNAHGIKSCSSH